MDGKGRRFVAYLRVSTDRQGQSGLGLEAQREAVARYVEGQGGRIVGEPFVEIESGRKNDRPQLAAALAACQRHRAVLVIAKLDRLARNVAFVSGLMESGVEFVAADMPMVNRLTIHILAAVAEEEARMISARTKAALAEAKKRGVLLGGAREGAYAIRPHAAEGNTVSTEKRQAKAAKRATELAPEVARLRASGVMTLRELAAGLNARDIPAPRGGKWSAVQVSRLLVRLEASTAGSPGKSMIATACVSDPPV
jgi:DNA invertase Pin-like site-specific DNA recombinase